MSGIGLLFSTAIDYERTHQLAIYTLLKESQLGSFLQNQNKSWDVLWEPEKQLFDLALVNNSKTYIELKMWSSLGDSQKNRQSAFLYSTGSTGFYILLGTSWFENSSQDVINFSKNTAIKIGYTELIALLNQIIVSGNETPDILELALSYRISLEQQYKHIKNSYKKGTKDKLYWYSLYDQIRRNLKTQTASIYTVNNPGGEVYIINDFNSWRTGKNQGVEFDLYCEIVNGILCIKFVADTDDTDIKRSLRDNIRNAIHIILGNTLTIVSVHPAKRNCLILSLKTRKIGWTFFVIFVIGKTASN